MELTVGMLEQALKGLDKNMTVVVKVDNDAYMPACASTLGIADVDFEGQIETCLIIDACHCSLGDDINLN